MCVPFVKIVMKHATVFDYRPAQVAIDVMAQAMKELVSGIVDQLAVGISIIFGRSCATGR